MKRPLALLFCLLAVTGIATAAGSTSHPSFWRYAHPQAKVLAGVEWQRLASTRMVEQIKQQFKKELGGSFKLAGIPSMPEMDFLSGIERIFVSSTGESKKVGRKKENPQFVAAIQGKFDLAKVRQLASKKGSRATAYKGVVMLLPTDGKTDQVMALVSPQVLLLGDRAGVQSALDNHATAGAPTADQTRLYVRAAELADRHDIWFVGAASIADLAGDQLPQAKMFADVESFEAGLSLQSGLGLELNLNTKTEEGARTMGSAIQGILALMSMGQTQPQATDFLKKVKVTSELARVSVALHVDQAEMDKSIAQFKVRSTPIDAASVDIRPKVTGETAWPPQTIAVVKPAEPAKPGVIKIYGAEGGTREIPLGSRP